MPPAGSNVNAAGRRGRTSGVQHTKTKPLSFFLPLTKFIVVRTRFTTKEFWHGVYVCVCARDFFLEASGGRGTGDGVGRTMANYTQDRAFLFYYRNQPLNPVAVVVVVLFFAFGQMNHCATEREERTACTRRREETLKKKGPTFLTRKITRGVSLIVAGKQRALYLGNLNALRDWGHARDYVRVFLKKQKTIKKNFILKWIICFCVLFAWKGFIFCHTMSYFASLSIEKKDDVDDAAPRRTRWLHRSLWRGPAHSVREFVDKSFKAAGVTIELKQSLGEFFCFCVCCCFFCFFIVFWAPVFA